MLDVAYLAVVAVLGALAFWLVRGLSRLIGTADEAPEGRGAPEEPGSDELTASGEAA